ncbi:hypothetical protein [uncultured Polaribacter sp.]|uniref:hypothetical protein n=1 Tax=uncultured Polaribacter sp. TaxID=174711 RepID=UPI002622AD56|nr:hypothetical protein [uncultured Polaribacter sp.]
MEKNKHHLTEDAFFKKYIQEIEVDKTTSRFTATIMDAILKEEQKTVLKPEPLISKKIWVVSVSFIATCLWFLFKGKSTSTYNFPALDTSSFSNIEFPNLFGSISISSTVMYTVITFSILALIQIAYLKNHFDKKFQ